MSTTDTGAKISFLCGKIKVESERLISLGIIQLWDGQEILVSPGDKGLKYVLSGKQRMIVVKNDTILAVYARPRIRLLRILEQGIDPTSDLLHSYVPLYPRQTGISREPHEQSGKRRHTRHWQESMEMIRPIIDRFYTKRID